ncbi:MAG: OmpA family protein [Pseudomonadota bacterium]
MSENDQKAQTERTKNTRRYARRIHGGGLAFFPYGFVPALALFLLSLFALMPFASLWIEDNAEQAALASLREKGKGWANVSASGQWITLSGEAPSAEQAAAAVKQVREARARTLFGRVRPVTKVIDRTIIASPYEAGPIPPEIEPTETVALEENPNHDPEDAEQEILAERERVAACDQNLKNLLIDSKIEFDSGSARISLASSGLLDQLARAIEGCDLRVVIEGHTDSTGSSDFNARLSLARAASVRDALVIRGVSADLLTPEGYGEDRPVADNNSPEGREQNRRIEFQVRSLSDPQD